MFIEFITRERTITERTYSMLYNHINYNNNNKKIAN